MILGLLGLIIFIIMLIVIFMWFKFLLKNKVPEKIVKILDKYSK